MNLTVEIENFKKIKNLKKEFTSGNIYVVSGKNDIGKTTFLQGIATLATGIPPKTKEIVSFGESEGKVKGDFLFDGADNNKYVVKWDFTHDKSRFTIIDPETNILKSNSKNNVIADIFKYNLFTIEEWFGWGLTSEGRKKQAEIILNLLPEKAKKEYEEIESLVSPKFGSLFIERTEVNKEYDRAKAVLDSFEISKEDLDLLNQEEGAKKLIYSLKEQLENALKSNIPALKEKVVTAEMNIIKNDDFITGLKSDINDIDEQIKALELRKKQKEDALKEAEKNAPILIKEMAAAQDELKNANPIVDIETLRKRISVGETLIESINKIKDKKADYEKAKGIAQLKLSKKEDLDQTIESKRSRKIQIIEENKLPVEKIVIEDGECFYDDNGNLIPFIKDSVSYSAGGMIILKLMAHLNKKLPIWLLGSAESYDDSRLAELQKIAEEYNGIIFMDKVIPGNQELTINVIEK